MKLASSSLRAVAPFAWWRCKRPRAACSASTSRHRPNSLRFPDIKKLPSGKHEQKQTSREEAPCAYLVFNYFPQNKLCDVTKYISNRVIFLIYLRASMHFLCGKNTQTIGYSLYLELNDLIFLFFSIKLYIDDVGAI